MDKPQGRNPSSFWNDILLMLGAFGAQYFLGDMLSYVEWRVVDLLGTRNALFNGLFSAVVHGAGNFFVGLALARALRKVSPWWFFAVFVLGVLSLFAYTQPWNFPAWPAEAMKISESTLLVLQIAGPAVVLLGLASGIVTGQRRNRRTETG